MENEELKPCPFCGGKAYIQKHSYRYVRGVLEEEAPTIIEAEGD